MSVPPPYLYFTSILTSLGAKPNPLVFRKFDESTTAGAKPDGAPLRLGGKTKSSGFGIISESSKSVVPEPKMIEVVPSALTSVVYL